MRTSPLGNTGVQVSQICLGTMYFGNQIDKKKSFSLLDEYYSLGGNFFDTANIYAFWIPGFSGGESETTIGDWLKLQKNRNNLFIATKVGFAYCDTQKGLRKQQIIHECEKSLKRLKIETIDLYYAHGDDFSTPLYETMDAFYNLIQQGKVRFIGASNFTTWRLHESQLISEMNNLSKYCCIQQRFSYLTPKPYSCFSFSQIPVDKELLDYCKLSNLSLIPYSVLLNGAYCSRNKSFPIQYQSLENQERLIALKKISNELNVSINQVVISWMLSYNQNIIPIIGASSKEQLLENVKSSDIRLSDSQIDTLNRLLE